MHKLIIVTFENGRGELVRVVGWEISRTTDTVLLSARMTQHNSYENISEVVTEISIDAIHTEELLEERLVHG